MLGSTDAGHPRGSRYGVRVALVVVLLLGALGCGVTGVRRLSDDEYRRQADRICSRAIRASEKLPRDTSPSTRSRLVARTIAQLAELTPPASEEAATRKWLAALRAGAVDAERTQTFMSHLAKLLDIRGRMTPSALASAFSTRRGQRLERKERALLRSAARSSARAGRFAELLHLKACGNA
jgi:hypothetical protein